MGRQKGRRLGEREGRRGGEGRREKGRREEGRREEGRREGGRVGGGEGGRYEVMKRMDALVLQEAMRRLLHASNFFAKLTT